MPKPNRQPSKPATTRRTAAAKKTDSRKSSTRASKKTTGGVLSSASPLRKLPLGKWRWNKISPERKLDILGVVLALVGLLTLLSLLSSENGTITGWWVSFVNRLAGWGSFILPVTLLGIGVWLVLRNVERLPMLSAERLTGVIFLYFNVLAWAHLLGGGGWELAAEGLGGGYIGAAFERLLVGALGFAGAAVALSAWLLIAIALSLDISISELFALVQKALASLARRVNEKLEASRARSQVTSGGEYARTPLQNLSAPVSHSPKSLSYSAPSSAPAEPLPGGFRPLHEDQSEPEPSAPVVPVAPPGSVAARHVRRHLQHGAADNGSAGAQPSPAQASSAAAAKTPGGKSEVKVTHQPAQPVVPWRLPALDEVLDPASVEAVKSNQDAERSRLIEETLISFGTPVRVVEIHRGPTVTQFGVEPLYVETRSGRTRVRVSKIVGLADDLALALAAPRIRIQAPVPGRNYVGIEVPNLEVSRVVMREMLESDAFKRLKSPLRFALGKDVAGQAKAYDLASMPHLLIAGTTGSGKSVCVNSLLACLLINNSPANLRLILVDPKRVELTGYNGIPHLLAPVIVEAEQVVGALQWVQREMDARYHRFSQVGARNIVDYNNKNSPALPYMVVLIDELADLMMLAPDETERSLTRLAQLARATGIHLVLATQRPSVDVVTGLIKANFPARIAFAVASGTDSRVILDQPGAERLLGRGDMLFQAPDAAAPARIQGVWVSDPEIQRVVDFWRNQAYELRDVNVSTPTATPVNMDMPINAPLKQTPLWGDDEKPGDPLLQDAINIVRQEGKASISMLQRKMRIGYTRAARLVDALEEKGIIGPAVATSQVREVLDYGEEHNSDVENATEDIE